MTITVLIAIASLLSLTLGIVLAAFQIRKAIVERKKEKLSGIDAATKSTAERDAIVVTSAEKAVLLMERNAERMEQALNAAYAENARKEEENKRLRNRIVTTEEVLARQAEELRMLRERVRQLELRSNSEGNGLL